MDQSTKDFKIVADSASDLLSLSDVDFGFAPLKIITSEKEYIDDQNLNVEEMVDFLLQYKGKSQTSCPNSEDWLRAFGDKKYIFCVTITGTLSGSYNSANIAKHVYEELYPDRKVYVINSLSTGPEIKLIVKKIRALILSGKNYEEICREVDEYSQKTGLLFVLESMKNLANNGRVNPIVAKAAGMLGIRVLGTASEIGNLKILEKCRGREKALKSVINTLKNQGVNKGTILIGHCCNLEAASALRYQLSLELPNTKVQVYNAGGLNSFYAEKGGLLIGFEKI